MYRLLILVVILSAVALAVYAFRKEANQITDASRFGITSEIAKNLPVCTLSDWKTICEGLGAMPGKTDLCVKLYSKGGTGYWDTDAKQNDLENWPSYDDSDGSTFWYIINPPKLNLRKGRSCFPVSM